MVADVYRSGWLSMGPQTEALEEEFAQYVGARHALAVANGTAGLHLPVRGLGPRAGRRGRRAVDDLRGHGQRDRLHRRDAGLRRHPRADRAVAGRGHRRRRGDGGHPRDHGHGVRGASGRDRRRWRSLARDRGLALLEDAAHAAGSRSGGRHLGTFGRAGAFSFFSNKNLAVGEGGMVVTDDDDLAARMRLLRSHGMTTLTWDRHRGHASDYDVVAVGFNYRIDEPRAALARRRLARLDAENGRRADLDARYRNLLDGTSGLALALAPVDGARPAHHLFTIVLDPDVERAAFREALARARDPDERSLPAGAPPFGSRMRRRPARDGGVRRAHGDVAAVRDDDRRPAGRGGERHSRGAHHPARRYRRTRAPILNVRLVLPAVTTTRSVRVARLR